MFRSHPSRKRSAMPFEKCYAIVTSTWEFLVTKPKRIKRAFVRVISSQQRHSYPDIEKQMGPAELAIISK